MIEKILEVYEKINTEFKSNFPPNNERTRFELKLRLAEEIGNEVSVMCDETNNTQFVLDNNCIVARVSWRHFHSPYEYHFCNLVFGQDEQVLKILETLN